MNEDWDDKGNHPWLGLMCLFIVATVVCGILFGAVRLFYWVITYLYTAIFL